MAPSAPTPHSVTLANWRDADHNRWAFRNVGRLIDVAPIANDPSNIAPLPRASRALRYSPLRSTALRAMRTDALVVLHQGEVVLEWYGPGNDAQSRHILMSSTKAVVGLLAGMLHGAGLVDLARPVLAYLPELERTGYQRATLRDLLDMRVALPFDAGRLARYEQAINWAPTPEGQERSDLAAFLRDLVTEPAIAGGPFRYLSANTDLLGWALERATARTIADLLSEHLWRPMGAECSAEMTVDARGLARSAGGMCVTARDFARLGQLLVDAGERDGRSIVAPELIADLQQGGDTQAWRDGEWGKSFAAISPNMRYRNGWYVIDDAPQTLFAMGVYGQNLFIDRANRIVVAKLSSWKKPLDYLGLWLTHRGYDQLRGQLLKRAARSQA